jgi:hypothetical protein
VRWHLHRDKAPNALREELARIERVLAEHASIVGQSVPSKRYPNLRRVYMKRVRYYLYYRVSDDGTSVHVLSLWQGNRGRGPRL